MPSIQTMERRIIRRLVTDAIAAGWWVTVDDGGEEMALERSTDVRAIIAACQNTDEDLLYFGQLASDSRERHGWVRLIYGESGWDVINDYTVNLDDIVAGAEVLAGKLEAAVR